MAWSYNKQGTVTETVLANEFGNMPNNCRVLEYSFKRNVEFMALCVYENPNNLFQEKVRYWTTEYRVTHYRKDDEVLCRFVTEMTGPEIDHLIEHHPGNLPDKIVKAYLKHKGK